MSTVKWNRFVAAAVDGLEWPTSMSDPTEECPSGFRLYNQNGVRACGRPVTSGGSCLSVCPLPTVDEFMVTRKELLMLFYEEGIIM